MGFKEDLQKELWENVIRDVPPKHRIALVLMVLLAFCSFPLCFIQVSIPALIGTFLLITAGWTRFLIGKTRPLLIKVSLFGFSSLWIVGIAIVLFSARYKVHCLISEGVELEEREHYRAAFDKFGQALTISDEKDFYRLKSKCLQSLGRSSLHIYGPSIAKGFFESNQVVALNHNFKDEIADSYIGLGDADLNSCHQAVAEKSFKSALAAYQEIKDKKGEAWAVLELGTIKKIHGDNKKAYEDFTNSEHNFHEIGYPIGEGMAIYQEGALLLNTGEITEARKRYFHALDLLQGRPDTGEEQALILVEIGRTELIQGHTSSALNYFEQAAGFPKDRGDTQTDAYGKTFKAKAEISRGHIDVARKLLSESIDDFRRMEDCQGLATALFYSGDLERLQAKSKEARADYGEAYTIFEEQGDKLDMGNITWALGNLEMVQSHLVLARQYFYESSSSFEVVGNVLGIATVRRSLGDLESLQGNYEAGVSHYTNAINVFQRVNDPLDEAGALLGLGKLELLRGRKDFAFKDFDLAKNKYDYIGDMNGRAYSLLAEGELDLSESHYADARKKFLDSRGLFQRIRDFQGEANLLVSLGQTEAMYGEIELANEVYSQAQDLYRKTGDNNGEANVLLVVGELLKNQSHYEASRSNLNRARLAFSKMKNVLGVANADCAIGEIDLAQTNIEAAEIELRSALDTAESLGDTYLEGRVNFAWAILELQRGNAQQATSFLNKAIQITNNTRDVYEIGRLLKNIGFVASQTGNSSVAINLFQQASNIYEKIGLKRNAEECKKHASQLQQQSSTNSLSH